MIATRASRRLYRGVSGVRTSTRLVDLVQRALGARRGVWVACYSDHSARPVIFRREVEAYRYAIDYSMQVRFVPFNAETW